MLIKFPEQMIRTFCLSAICFFSITILQCQNFDEVEINEINVRKFKKISKFISWDHTMSGVGKDFNRVFFYIKFDFNSNKNNVFDLNKFSLVDPANKLRFRIVDASYNNVLGGLVPAYKIAKNPKARQSLPYIKYDPYVPDTFNNYDIEGYKNLEFEVRTAPGKKNTTFVYLKPIKRKSLKKAKLYFGVPKVHKNSEYLLYYGKQIIGTYSY